MSGNTVYDVEYYWVVLVLSILQSMLALYIICSWSYGVVLYEIFTVGKLLFFLINDNNGLRRGSFLCNRFWRRSLFEFLYFQVDLHIREWMARKLLAYFNKNTGCQSHSTWMTNCNSISILLNHSLKLYPSTLDKKIDSL